MTSVPTTTRPTFGAVRPSFGQAGAGSPGGASGGGGAAGGAGAPPGSPKTGSRLPIPARPMPTPPNPSSNASSPASTSTSSTTPSSVASPRAGIALPPPPTHSPPASLQQQPTPKPTPTASSSQPSTTPSTSNPSHPTAGTATADESQQQTGNNVALELLPPPTMMDLPPPPSLPLPSPTIPNSTAAEVNHSSSPSPSASPAEPTATPPAAASSNDIGSLGPVLSGAVGGSAIGGTSGSVSPPGMRRAASNDVMTRPMIPPRPVSIAFTGSNAKNVPRLKGIRPRLPTPTGPSPAGTPFASGGRPPLPPMPSSPTQATPAATTAATNGTAAAGQVQSSPAQAAAGTVPPVDVAVQNAQAQAQAQSHTHTHAGDATAKSVASPRGEEKAKEENYKTRDALLYAPFSKNGFMVLESLLKVCEHSEMERLSKAYVDYLNQKDEDGAALLSLLERAIETEVENTTDPTTLFRSNSRASKLLSFSMRARGIEYLQEALGEVIHSICSSLPTVEIDPTKIKPEESMTNTINLTNVCSSFLRRIVSSIDSCPIFIRKLCAHLQKVASGKFVDNKQIVDNYSPIGGLLFLRFFCSAIFSPQAYGIIKDTPSPDAMRILILVSKVLQMLANGLSFSNVTSEDYMTSMNPFLETYLDRLTTFYRLISTLEESDTRNEEIEKMKFCIPSGVDCWMHSAVSSPRNKKFTVTTKPEPAFDTIHFFLHKHQDEVGKEMEARGHAADWEEVAVLLQRFICPELPAESGKKSSSENRKSSYGKIKSLSLRRGNKSKVSKDGESAAASDGKNAPLDPEAVKQNEAALAELKTILQQLKEERQQIDEQIADVEQQILTLSGSAADARKVQRTQKLKKAHSSGAMREQHKLEKEKRRLEKEKEKAQKVEEKPALPPPRPVVKPEVIDPWKKKATDGMAEALGLNISELNELINQSTKVAKALQTEPASNPPGSPKEGEKEAGGDAGDSTEKAEGNNKQSSGEEPKKEGEDATQAATPNETKPAADPKLVASSGSRLAEFEQRQQYLKELVERAAQASTGLVKDRKHHFRTHKNAFVGSEFVDWLMDKEKVAPRPTAVALGRELAESSLIRGLAGDSTSFEDKKNLYKFSTHVDVMLVSPPSSPSTAPPNPFGSSEGVATTSSSSTSTHSLLSSSGSGSLVAQLNSNSSSLATDSGSAEDVKLETLYFHMKSELNTKNTKAAKKSFSATEATDWIASNQHVPVASREEATQLLDKLKTKAYIKCVSGQGSGKEEKKSTPRKGSTIGGAPAPPATDEPIFVFLKKRGALKGGKQLKKSKN